MASPQIIDDAFAPVATHGDRTYRCVNSLVGLERLCEILRGAKTAALDWETTTAELWSPEFDYLGIALAVDSKEGYYIPLGHELPAQRSIFRPKAPVKISLEMVRKYLGPILPKLQLLMHNAKFDAAVLRRAEIPFNPNTVWDTYIAAGLVNDTREKKLGLKALTREWLGRDALEIKDLTGNKKLINMRWTPLESVIRYAGDDACNTVQLWRVEREKFKRYGGPTGKLYQIFRKMEMPIVPIVGRMEQRGIKVDVAKLQAIEKHAALVCAKAEDHLRRACTYPFEPGRPDHVRHMLYDELCLPVARKGGKDTAERKQLEVIFELMKGEPRRRAQPFFKAWCAWSKANKIRNTYTSSIWDRLDSEGRIHPSFFQIDTLTGRMSSGRPINFQNIIRDAGKLLDVRSAFVPDPGWVFILADFSQMEFKIASAMSQDPRLIEAANNPDIDVHVNTARAIFNIPEGGIVTADQRQAAKTSTYAIQYLASAYGLAKMLLLKPHEAEKIIRAFYGLYPGLEAWVERMKESILQKGYSSTFYGRRRWADKKLLLSPQPDTRESEFRKLVNMRVQGTGADIIKLAMKHVDRWFRESGLRSHIVGQIHDELVILSPEDEAAMVAPKVEEIMTTQILDVTLPVETDIKTSLSKSKAALWPGRK